MVTALARAYIVENTHPVAIGEDVFSKGVQGMDDELREWFIDYDSLPHSG